jgi:hypothetical protein
MGGKRWSVLRREQSLECDRFSLLPQAEAKRKASNAQPLRIKQAELKHRWSNTHRASMTSPFVSLGLLQKNVINSNAVLPTRTNATARLSLSGPPRWTYPKKEGHTPCGEHARRSARRLLSVRSGTNPVLTRVGHSGWGGRERTFCFSRSASWSHLSTCGVRNREQSVRCLCCRERKRLFILRSHSPGTRRVGLFSTLCGRALVVPSCAMHLRVGAFRCARRFHAQLHSFFPQQWCALTARHLGAEKSHPYLGDLGESM